MYRTNGTLGMEGCTEQIVAHPMCHVHVKTRNIPGHNTRRAAGNAARYAMPTRTTDESTEDAVRRAQLYEGQNAPAGTFQEYDLDTLVEALSAGAALFTVSGTMSETQLKGGREPLRLSPRAEGRFDPGSGLVYLGHLVGTDPHTADAAKHALLCAIHHSGATAVVDGIPVDGQDRPRQLTFSDAGLATGAIHALRLLAAQFSASTREASSCWLSSAA